MKIYEFQAKVDTDKVLQSHEDFLSFAKDYLEFVGAGKKSHPNIQADIVSQNESNYHFFQYKDDGAYCVTRPVNTNLFISADDFDDAVRDFKESLKDVRSIVSDKSLRENINRVIYTCQQCIGCTLDAFNNPNKARKRNGALFEILVKSVINSAGVKCESIEESVKINKTDSMKFQHDLALMKDSEKIKAIGQLKTSSKDRIDKVFLDRMMYKKLAETDIPYFAVFLNDVQRKSNKEGSYSINSTFLPGHFKAYTMALHPLDGVYYFDLRPTMSSDEFLKNRISKFDQFLVEDMWNFIK